MLFDLKGRRRRVVQVTYVGLALLMGGGLVLSGIGSSASGGLLDALIGNGSSGGGSSSAKKPFQNQIKAAEARLARNPKDPAALAQAFQGHYGLAQVETDSQTSTPTKDGALELQAADTTWQQYVATNPATINPDLAARAVALYGVIGPPKDDPKTPAVKENEAPVVAARALAQSQNSSDAYVKLVTVATEAGDTRTADLAGKKAISLAATADDKKLVKSQVDMAKANATPQQSGAGATTAPNGTSTTTVPTPGK
ncbi:MAG: hypothetical protein QOJ07_3455 [Thermoleophilaceae bacterium]|jgi:hypothetical protein|nr:hypothetical protein [Thermoleophilaceae bacterium]